MKQFLIGGIALAVMAAGPAAAADMPIKAPLQQPVAYYDWSGAYLGFNAGGAWYDVTHVFTTPGSITPNVTTNDRDAIFGFHAGAQWQWGAWVVGVEAALSGCFHECRSTSGVLPVAQGFEPNVFGEHKITNLFTVGPRLGYAWDRLMIFATAAGRRPISRTPIARPSPTSATDPVPPATARRATAGGMRAAASTTWCTGARWSMWSLASNISTST